MRLCLRIQATTWRSQEVGIYIMTPRLRPSEIHLRYTSGLKVSVTGRDRNSWSATALNWQAPDLRQGGVQHPGNGGGGAARKT